MAGNKYKRLGDMLVADKAITEDQLMEALALQKQSHDRLGKVLIDNNIISEGQLIDTLSRQLGIDYIDLSSADIDPSVVKYVPRSVARKYSVVPVKVVRDVLYLAMADPLNFPAIEEVRRTSKLRIVQMIASTRGVEHAISTLYGNEGAAEAISQMRAEAGLWSEGADQINEEEGNRAAAPAIRLVNSIIERGVNENASDIHFEPSLDDMHVRMRIDGRLHNIINIPKDIQDSVISRLKIMGRMNLVERRIPQDGRARIRFRGKSIDLRMSTLPTVSGEKVVIRLLSQDMGLLDRKGIGITPEESVKLDKIMASTSGVILIVGPTGSGKSSTMYTLLRELLDESVNLVTLEDPVEYTIQGATQVQINEATGLTFASGLRSVLRQDPDIICVGEIRDGETAEIAMRAAMTGHLVISTIHTEDAVSAVDRLKDMGVEPYLIAGGLRGVISQRLLRRVCPNCREEYVPDSAKIRLAGIDPGLNIRYYRGRGCEQCFHTGYRGRTGVFEILPVTADLRKAITRNEDKDRIRQLMDEAGFQSMNKSAETLVARGITTVEEVCRVLAITDQDF